MTETYALLKCKSDEGQARLERMLNRIFTGPFTITKYQLNDLILICMKNGLADSAILKASFPALSADNPDLERGLLIPSKSSVFFSFLELVPPNKLLDLFTVAKNNPSVYYETYELIADLDKEILETVQVYIENNCSPLLSSYALFVHKDTVTYRLHLFKRKTGISMDSFADRMFVHGLITSRNDLDSVE